MLHKDITEEEEKAVFNKMFRPRLTQEELDNGKIQDEANETPKQWYDRNVSLVGEEKAVLRFKKKAEKQKIIEKKAKD